MAADKTISLETKVVATKEQASAGLNASRCSPHATSAVRWNPVCTREPHKMPYSVLWFVLFLGERVGNTECEREHVASLDRLKERVDVMYDATNVAFVGCKKVPHVLALLEPDPFSVSSPQAAIALSACS